MLMEEGIDTKGHLGIFFHKYYEDRSKEFININFYCQQNLLAKVASDFQNLLASTKIYWHLASGQRIFSALTLTSFIYLEL